MKLINSFSTKMNLRYQIRFNSIKQLRINGNNVGIWVEFFLSFFLNSPALHRSALFHFYDWIKFVMRN